LTNGLPEAQSGHLFDAVISMTRDCMIYSAVVPMMNLVITARAAVPQKT
jgi:hypothetical protein